MNSVDSLRQIIAETPVLGAPPRLSRRGAAPGLALLESALTLGHVRRLTERLQVDEYRNSRRCTEVDVNLELVDPAQRHVLGSLTPVPAQARDEAAGRPMLWLPIARVPGDAAIPIEVRGSTGERLPTMTRYETSRLLAAGMYQLFRAILTSHEDARDRDTELSAFLYRIHEPRWLVQQAIIVLLTERNAPTRLVDQQPTATTVEGVNRQYRDMAFRILEKYEPALADYFRLLAVAAGDYFLVAAFDQSRDEHIVSYVSPLYADQRPPLTAELTRRINSARNGYYIRYTSEIPASLRSYHLVVETLDGLDIATMFLRTDVDRKTTDSVAADLESAANELDRFTPDEPRHDKKILELEVQHVLRRLNDLWRRRRWDTVAAGTTGFADAMPACSALVRGITSGEAVTDERSGDVDNSAVRHPLITPENLRLAAREIVDHELQYDFSFERDPVGRQAHASWRRPAGRRTAADQITVVSSILIVDSSTSGPRTVRSYALAVSAITYIVACLLDRFPFPLAPGSHPLAGHGSPDALVTVLLLIPGFLYSRLPLPPRRSIAGYMQIRPRLVSHGCIFLVAALGAAVAANAPNTLLYWLFGVGVVLPALSTLVLRDPPSRRSVAESITELGGPKWLRETADQRRRGPRKPDENLSSRERAT